MRRTTKKTKRSPDVEEDEEGEEEEVVDEHPHLLSKRAKVRIGPKPLRRWEKSLGSSEESNKRQM